MTIKLMLPLIFGITVLSYLMPLASAQFQNQDVWTQNLCLDNSTLQTERTVIVNAQTFNITSNTACSFGCDTENNKCNSSPFDTLLIYGIAITVGLAVVILLVKKVLK
jgi:hypothetical protein